MVNTRKWQNTRMDDDRRNLLDTERRKERNETSIFRLIKCLPIMWTVFTRILAKQVHGHMEREKLFSDEQKGCRRHSRGTKDQLKIDKMVMNCNLIVKK